MKVRTGVHIMGSAGIYETIIEINYEYWISENEIEMSIEDFRCEVDIKYRREHKQFPLWDEDMEERLDSVADGVGVDFLNATIEAAEKLESDFHISKIKEQLLNHIELFLRYKSKVEDQEYPQNRRLKRKDVWQIQKMDFMANEIESEDGYLEAFEKLVKKGYFKLVETGGDIKHDIFHAIEV
tara:strand:- start:1320 stop:1868 length:549 start_codon:yes stop_codon:yes gene_type:complete